MKLKYMAGWYGLVAARTYLRLRPAANLIIIDSDSTVGGVWSRDQVYPNLVAQVRLGVSGSVVCFPCIRPQLISFDSCLTIPILPCLPTVATRKMSESPET
jgi:hypothetical protein